MATNLDYQKARRIRNASFADILSDQLAGDSTIRGAIKKTISLRAQARVKGFKEKFDPLNIAKFLTGGSSLGPALLGKLTGRSQRDIQYFSGRMQPIRDRGTASRIGKEPGTGMGEGTNEMLRKIYYLMQVTRQSDLERRDAELNFAEEKKLEAEKRHKELLKVLSSLRLGTASKVAEEEGGSSLLDLLGRASLASRLMNVLKWFASPVGLALLGVTSLVGLIALLSVGLDRLAKNKANDKALSPAEARNILENASPQDIESYGGREYLADIVKNGRQRAVEALAMPENTEEEKEAKKLTILNLGGRAKVEQIEKDTKVYEVPTARAPLPGTEGKLAFTKKEFIGTGLAAKRNEEEWNRVYAPYYNDDGTRKTGVAAPASVQTSPPQAPPAAPAAGSGSANPSPAAMPAPATRSMAPASATSPGSDVASMAQMPSPAAPAMPASVPGTGLTSRLNDAVSQNLNVNLPITRTSSGPTVVNNVNNAQQRQMPQKVATLDTIAVRNVDPTFMRLIMDNTRVV
jgi:hypothetical protein